MATSFAFFGCGRLASLSFGLVPLLCPLHTFDAWDGLLELYGVYEYVGVLLGVLLIVDIDELVGGEWE